MKRFERFCRTIQTLELTAHASLARARKIAPPMPAMKNFPPRRLRPPTLLTLALFAALFALACPAAFAVPSNQRVTIHYWTGWTGQELAALQRLARKFEQSHPTIAVNVLSVAGAYEKVRIAFAGGAPPDICSALWPEDLPDFVVHGYVQPLDGFFAQSGRTLDEWYPAARKLMVVGQHIYGISVTCNPFFVFYNRALFAEAGIQAPHIRTIDDLSRAIEATTKRKDGRLVQIGMLPPSFVEITPKFGGQLYDESQNAITPDDPGAIAAMQWLSALVQRMGKSDLQAFLQLTGNMQSGMNPFYGGRAAMLVSSVWEEKMIARYAPHLNYGYFAFPWREAGRPDSAFVSGSVFIIARASRHRQEAWQFLEWLSRPEQVAQLCKDFANVPATMDAGRVPAFSSPLMQFALSLLASPDSYVPPRMPLWSAYRMELQRAEERIVYGGAPLVPTLIDLKRRFQPKLVELYGYLSACGVRP